MVLSCDTLQQYDRFMTSMNFLCFVSDFVKMVMSGWRANVVFPVLPVLIPYIIWEIFCLFKVCYLVRRSSSNRQITSYTISRFQLGKTSPLTRALWKRTAFILRMKPWRNAFFLGIGRNFEKKNFKIQHSALNRNSWYSLNYVIGLELVTIRRLNEFLVHPYFAS